MKILLFVMFAVVGIWLLASGGKKENVLDAQKFQAELISQSGVLIDVRTPGEFAEGHLTGAQNINFSAEDFKEKVAALDKEKTYFVYCRSGGRSAKSAEIFEELGLKVFDLAGGILDWKAKGLPVTQ